MRRAAKRTFKIPPQNKLARVHRRKARKVQQRAAQGLNPVRATTAR